MKYCVNGRQPYSVLKKADEIKMNYVDKDKINDFIEQIPDKTIILDFPPYKEPEFDLWNMYNERLNSFYIGLHDLSRAHEFLENSIKWYWPYPITSFYELVKISVFKPSMVILGPPLSFDLKKVKDIIGDCSIRLCCNSSGLPYIPTIPGLIDIKGQWIRPEDVYLYEDYVDVLEFDETDLTREETLLHIYKDNKQWPGKIELLINGLNISVDNRGIPDEFAERRLNCGQKCLSGGLCKNCDLSFEFAKLIVREKNKRLIETNLKKEAEKSSTESDIKGEVDNN